MKSGVLNILCLKSLQMQHNKFVSGAKKTEDVYWPVKLNIFDLLSHYITSHTKDGRKYQAYVING